MNKLLVAVVLLGFGTAYAQTKTEKPAAPPSGATAAPPAGEMMTPPKPGPEQDALKPFSKSGTSAGTRMSPDGKEMPTKAKVTCKWIDNNMWAACDIDETVGAGKMSMHWMGHWVYGYDTMAKGYRGVMADNFGMMGRMKGTVDGTKIVWESMDEMKGGPPGMPAKERVTMDAADPKAVKMTFEGWMNGKWTPMGASTMKSAGK
jgi:hypothetical protein